MREQIMDAIKAGLLRARIDHDDIDRIAEHVEDVLNERRLLAEPQPEDKHITPEAKPLCPLSTIDQGLTVTMTSCNRQCAWYDAHRNKCAMLVIARKLDDLEEDVALFHDGRALKVRVRHD